MKQIIEVCNELQAEVYSLRRSLARAEDNLWWWVIAMVLGACLFGVLMFVAGAHCEATRTVMEVIR